MKKFITTAARQWIMPKPNETILPYTFEDSSRLQCPILTPFPVVPLVYGCVSEGDEFQVIVLTAVGNERGCCAEDNFRFIQEAVREAAAAKKASASFIKVEIPIDESSETHLDTFRKLIELFESDDFLYVDITYGTKTTPLIQLMALNYAYQCKGAVVDCVCYGEAVFDRETHKIIGKKLYEVTSLFLMQQIVNTLAKSGAANPLDTIRGILTVSEHSDDDVDWEDEEV